MRDEITPLTPLEDKPPKISSPKNSAAGIPAVVSTMKYGLTNMGVINSISKLSKVNDFHGFDCPGCAWPDPAHRTMTEFCENGAKAVAEEATLARVTREFFASHSVEQFVLHVEFLECFNGWLVHGGASIALATQFGHGQPEHLGRFL